jgi:hypothetical protein
MSALQTVYFALSLMQFAYPLGIASRQLLAAQAGRKESMRIFGATNQIRGTNT